MYKTSVVFLMFIVLQTSLIAQNEMAMQNIDGRNFTSLNGRWSVIIDPTDNGTWRKVWIEPKVQSDFQFFEYSFEGGPTLAVPGDFNSQQSELAYYESVVWYKQTFEMKPKPGERYFIHFGAVNYLAKVYLNEMEIGSHEGGFTPFQFEVTGKVREGKNTLVVWVNNERRTDGVPAKGYDWLNYGGITRDVRLVTSPASYIKDYFIQLKKGSNNEANGWIRLDGENRSQSIIISIPELKKKFTVKTNADGYAAINFKAEFELWSPLHPKLYVVNIQSETDRIADRIGFRNVDVNGSNIMVNGVPVFLKAVNIHEENPLNGSRANSKADSKMLLDWAKELGCNMVRLAHYPHNENMVRMAEEMGLMVWSEIPVYQNISFENQKTVATMKHMLQEMIARDKNRCSVIVWSVSNETYSSPARDKANIEMVNICRESDPTKLVSAAISNQGYRNHTFNVWDTFVCNLDIISVNQYAGWYVPWQGEPSEVKWNLVCDKPLFISEFGGEAHYGSNHGPKNMAAYWSEEFQEQIYRNQIKMFGVTPNLCGVCPWLLIDYRSTSRLHPVYQSGWNRKGLLSDKGQKKKAWFTMKEYFDSINY